MNDINYQRRAEITRQELFQSFNNLIESIERQHITFDTYGAQALLRPVDTAIREAQRQVDIQTERSTLLDQERQLSGLQNAIKEQRQKIDALESKGEHDG